MRRWRTSGSAVLETALWIPILLLLIVGMIQIGKITYLYYSLDKIVYSAARQVSLQSGINFCDMTSDTRVQAILSNAVSDSSGTALVNGLASGMLEITPLCTDSSDPAVAPSPCDTSSCPGLNYRPSYIRVTLPNGYTVQPRIPFVTLEPIVLRPSVLLPFGGVS
jgi:hypothetical protein